jgi:hypothetical protein
MFRVGGREVQQMGRFGMMPGIVILWSLQWHTILLMLDFQPAIPYLFHTVGKDTTSKSGAKLHRSECNGAAFYIPLIIIWRPRNFKELFYLHHLQAWNIIEWIFGVEKWQFCIMVAAPEYSLEKQAKLVNAICALHNFIWAYDPDDGDEINLTEVERASPQHLWENFTVDVTVIEREEASEKWDQIAKVMWEQYVAYNEGLWCRDYKYDNKAILVNCSELVS